MKLFDAIVTGTGQAGPSLANPSSQEGLVAGMVYRSIHRPFS